jgi:REP element-mobilizing transposase RayT
MKKKVRKHTQISLLNIKGAGRPAKNDAGIRHTSRPLIIKPSSLHLTVKVKHIKADIKNKIILHLLKRAIMNGRRQGLKIIHFSLEYDHVHLLIEADNNTLLGKGMKAFGVTFAKAINRLRKLRGAVYKHRYHFRRIESCSQLKNVLHYIFNNGIRHGTSSNVISRYNSLRAEEKYYLFCKKLDYDFELIKLLDLGKIYFSGLVFV